MISKICNKLYQWWNKNKVSIIRDATIKRCKSGLVYKHYCVFCGKYSNTEDLIYRYYPKNPTHVIMYCPKKECQRCIMNKILLKR